ncbi:hypothetical protein [Trinickia sp. Y13]|uniref:hypothetical protein n=1 Tax=Trinickia sp. Y13 TaxID=2917807 RepID=UPI002406B1D7|nr:hypothetical protein [Trinickia sp. Y13]MDG0024935.1 hypothetical protein [Trinickia sp. Y13]
MTDKPKNLPRIERMMFVVGEPDAGKSTTLRSLFVDPRFGTKRVVPTESRIRLVGLSKERCLFMRLTSPHETKQNINQFLKTIEAAQRRAARLGFRRFNVACALQPFAARAMPDLHDVCSEALHQLLPERMRVVVIDPRQDGQPGPSLSTQTISELRRRHVELVRIDGQHARHEYPNGLLLADFFDFT